jgi:hypothetical protein
MSFDEDRGIPGWEPEDYTTVGLALSAYFENRIDWKARPPEPPAAPPTPSGVPSGPHEKAGSVVQFRPRGQNNPKWFSDYMEGKDTSEMSVVEKKKAVATGVATTAAIRGTAHVVKKKLAQRAALKAGAKVGAKGLMKWVPGIGWAIMAADAAPEAWAVGQESASASAQALRDVRDAEGITAKGKAALAGSFDSWKRGVTGSARVGAAAFVGSDVVKMGREAWAQDNDGASIVVRTGGKVAGRVARKMVQRLAKSPGFLGTLQRGAAATPKYLKAAEGVFMPVLKSTGKWIGIGAATVAGGATVVATTKATLRGLKQNPRPSGPIVLRFIPHPTIATWIGAASQATVFAQMRKKLGPLYDTSKGKNVYGQWTVEYPVSIAAIVTGTGKRGVSISVSAEAYGSLVGSDAAYEQYKVGKRWFDNLDKQMSEWRSSTGYVDIDDATVSSRENPRQKTGLQLCKGGCGRLVKEGTCEECQEADERERQRWQEQDDEEDEFQRSQGAFDNPAGLSNYSVSFNHPGSPRCFGSVVTAASEYEAGRAVMRSQPGAVVHWDHIKKVNAAPESIVYLGSMGAPTQPKPSGHAAKLVNNPTQVIGEDACTRCAGTGFAGVHGDTCTRCDGSGRDDRVWCEGGCGKRVRDSQGMCRSCSNADDAEKGIVRDAFGYDIRYAPKPKTRWSFNNPQMAAFVGGGTGLRTRDLVPGPRGGYTPAQRDSLPDRSFLVPERRAWPVSDENHVYIALQYMTVGRGKRSEYPMLIQRLAHLWPVDQNTDIWKDYAAKKSKIEAKCGCRLPTLAQIRRA